MHWAGGSVSKVVPSKAVVVVVLFLLLGKKNQKEICLLCQAVKGVGVVLIHPNDTTTASVARSASLDRFPEVLLHPG